MAVSTDNLSTANAGKAPAGGGVMTHKQILTILSGLMAGMFLAALDQTVVSTAIRTIGDDLHGQSLQAWVTTAYLITSTIATPLYGKLSDIYGRRPFFLLAISLFVIGSLACSFSTSMYELAGFRAFQGLGAGGLFSLSLAIMGDILAPRERAKYQGYFMAVFGTSSVLGPLIGGVFAGAGSILGIAGWRWVFLVNVPIGLIALAVVFKVLHIPFTKRDHRIDWWGAAALVLGLVPLLTVAEQGQQWGWTSPGVLALIALGVIGLVSFVLIEIKMKQEALIPMRLFRNAGFSLMQVTGVLVGMAMFGAILTLPLFLQIVRGATPTQSGLQMMAMTIGLMAGAVISGQLTARTGRYKIFPQVGLALVAIAAVMLAFLLKTDTPDIGLWAMIFVLGFGLGNCMQSLTLATQNAVPSQEMGVATSSATFFRQVGGTIGVAVFLSVLFSLLPKNIGTRIGTAMANPEFQQAAAVHAGSSDPTVIQQSIGALGQRMETDTSFLQKVPSVLGQPFKQGFVDSMHPVFLAAGAVAAIAFIVLLFFKEIPLRMTSALAERQQEAADEAAQEGAAQEGAVQEGAVQEGAAQEGAAQQGAVALTSRTGSHDAGDVPSPAADRIPGVSEDQLSSANQHGRHSR